MWGPIVGQSYQEEIFSDVNYQFANGTFTALSVNRDALLANFKKGCSSSDGEETKGSS